MYNKNNDYERNRKNENAIVYQTAEGKTITLTGADFESEADFLQWKKWSDNDYHDTERAENRRKRHEISTDTYPERHSLEDAAPFLPCDEKQLSQRIILHHELKTLTTTQYVRFMLYMRGYSISEIARMEHIHRKNVNKSIYAAKKKLCDFLNNL